MGLRVAIIGAPGAGKGTQARLISKAYHAPQVSTGEIFRDHLRRDTAIGRKVRPYLAAGQLAPDDLTCRLVAERLEGPDCADGYVLDGFPRSLEQAEGLLELCTRRGEALNGVFDLDVPDDVIVERITARRSCPKCGIIYSLVFNPPKDPRYCDQHPEPVELLQREDDTAATVRKRLEVYHAVTRPILDYYRVAGILQTVEADGCSPDQVFRKIESLLAAQGVPRPRDNAQNQA